MHKICAALAILFIFTTKLHAQSNGMVAPLAPAENIYRHYTGAIGAHKAVLDLRYGPRDGSNFGGSTCYFTDEAGLNFFLITPPGAGSHDETLRAQVFPENAPLTDIKNVYSILVQTRRFDFKLSNDSLIGKWFNPAEMHQLDINLKEDYSDAIPFIFQNVDDSITATGRNNETMKAIASYRGIGISPEMNKKDRAFINSVVARFMNQSKTSIEEPQDLPDACIQNFFAAFRKAVSESREVDGGGFTGIYTLFPVYNSCGLLVLQKGGYQYDFEHKEYTDRYLYLCLDVTNKKALKLNDVLDVNNDVLTPLLENAFRKKYHLEPGKKLSDLFVSDKMPLTDNFIIVNKGLIFSYSPTKIFKDDQDISELQEMRLFLSYGELGSMLKPEFKNRIGLQ